MPQVSLPADFFLREAKQEYSRYQERLVTEAAQNSLDSGANEINFIFTDTYYSCRDNGCGMDRERMIAAMLTMGGSIKEAGSRGGFGAAKKLLVFSGSSYYIKSQNTLAEGMLLDYELTDIPYFKGTEISATYIDPNDFKVATMLSAVRSLCEKSYFSAKVTVNGEEIKKFAEMGKRVSELSSENAQLLGYLYVNKDKKDSYIHILANGLYSYSAYAGNEIEQTFLDIVIPSKEAFNQSRESLKGEVAKAFDAIRAKMAADNKSWAKKRHPITKIKGKKESWKQLVTKIKQELEAFHIFIDETFTKEEMEVVLAGRAATIPNKNEILKEIHDVDNLPEVDFYYNPGDSGVEYLPAEYNPLTGKKTNKLIYGIYKACIEDVLCCIRRSHTDFVIGVTFETTAIAEFQNRDGLAIFYINPTKGENIANDAKEKFCSIYASAMHECAHLTGGLLHSESFASALSEINKATLFNSKGYVSIMKDAREYQDRL